MVKKATIALVASGVGITTLIALKLDSIVKICESYNCIPYSPTTPERQVNIKGVNQWFWPEKETLADYAVDLEHAVSLGFNSIRFALSKLAKLPQPQQIAYAQTVKTFPFKLVPTLFDQKNIIYPTLEEAKAWIDFWVWQLPNVYCWDFYNEPWSGSDIYRNKSDVETYYNKIRVLLEYLRSKTTAPITIGFHNYRQEAFERLNDLCDIISFHYYPTVSEAFGRAFQRRDITYHLPRLLRIGIPIALQKTSWPIKQTGSEPNDLLSLFDWLESFNKPFLLNEWGFAVDPEGKLENCQVCYVSNILKAMRHPVHSNFSGYHYYAFREPIPSAIWNGILRYDRTLRPAAELFP